MLLIEDSPDDEALLLRSLKLAGFEVEHVRVDTEPGLREALKAAPWDIVISDFNLPAFDALAALEIVKLSKLDLPFVIVSGTVGEDVAVQAMRSGAHDYVMKANLRRLPETIRREVAEAKMRRERRSLEQQVRQAQKMEAVGQLATGVAHDFNNLLTVILSFTQFVRDDLPADHVSRNDLSEVIDCAARAAGLTRQLLTFSRKSVNDPSFLDLNTVLTSSEKMLIRLLGNRIDYVTVQNPTPVYVYADRGLLEQVVVNLIVNARDAMPEGGKLTVETTVGEQDGKPMVMLSVTDTGVGMSPDVQARIFEPFFTTKSEGRGTGLGLSTVHGIVEQCGGTISVYSEVGKGTTFNVSLPHSNDARATTPLSRELVRSTGHETVLVVEDLDAVRAAVVRTLTAAGYQVLEASRPNEALQLLDQHPERVHLLLTDFMLPEMTGQDLVKRLRAKRPDVAVLFMSGFASGALSHQGVVEAGMSFLQKPFTPDVLAQKVRAALDSEVAAHGMRPASGAVRPTGGA